MRPSDAHKRFFCKKVKYLNDIILRFFNVLRFRKISETRAIAFIMIAAVLTALLINPTEASALPVETYASSSRLSSGKWVKVKVEQTGIQFVSAANLRKMGFSNPENVRVYGFGGRILPTNFAQFTADDLPRVASSYTSKGLYFFGYDHIRWTLTNTRKGLEFFHTMHQYAEESWYFLSDSDPDTAELPSAPTAEAPVGAQPVNTFICNLVHEQDIIHPSNSGSRYLGEDFRSPTRRSFDFTLTDAIDGENCTAKIGFASNTNGSSQLKIEASGGAAPTNAVLKLQSNSDSEVFMKYDTIVSPVTTAGNNLKLDLTFQGSGTISLARLDYIEVSYLRKIKLNGGQIFFNVTEGSPSKVTIEGAESGTVVWDVTDPARHSVVKTTAEGALRTFVSPGGYRQYVAFTPDKTGFQISDFTDIPNQNIHALAVPDMLIIAPSEFREAAVKMANHHREYDGLKVEILTPEEIYNEFSSGTPDVTAFRRLLKMWYDRGLAASPDSDSEQTAKIKYCLLMGQATFDNKKKTDRIKNASYPFIPIWQSYDGFSHTSSYSTDDYIGMLEDSDVFNIGREKILVAVGRMPFHSAQEALALTDKYIRYVTKPETGTWRNRLMFVADDQNNGDHLSQTESMISSISDTPDGKRFRIEKIYLDSYTLEQTSRGDTYPKAKEKMLEMWNNGVSMINYIGHANTVSWTHEDLLNWKDILSFTNTRLPFIYAATCEFGRNDDATRSGSEVLWAYPESGIIAILSPNRTVYIDQNGKLSREMGKTIMKRDQNGKLYTVGESMIMAKNNYPGTSNTNKLRYNLLGNPAMRLPIPPLTAELGRIGDVDADNITNDNLPVLKAQGKVNVSGVINDDNGAVDENFNGTIEINLYDAEQALTTLGNGKDGVISHYNDRKTLLYRGRTKVVNGKWETTVLLPAEIENNYSPAQFLFYASSDDNKEAHGEFSRFYVYGSDEDAEEDTKGPQIRLFGLNHEQFKPGETVHTSPIVMATVADESGINVSDAGIGHKMTLQLDGKTYFNDVNNYYTPDADDSTAGSILYPLSDLEPGRHTLRLTVWDNASNSSTASIDFEVAVAKTPEIYSLTTDVNPARDHVNFMLKTDRPKSRVECRVEVFDLNGRRVWSSESQTATDSSAGLTIGWNLCDGAGARVPRGIYLYRATVISPEGPSATKSYRLAVTAP